MDAMKVIMDRFGQPNTCARCDKVMTERDDGHGPYCDCPRIEAEFIGGPLDGEVVRGLYRPDGSIPDAPLGDGEPYHLWSVNGNQVIYLHGAEELATR